MAKIKVLGNITRADGTYAVRYQSHITGRISIGIAQSINGRWDVSLAYRTIIADSRIDDLIALVNRC